MTGKIKIDTEMFIIALDDHNDETNHYLDKHSGEILYFSDYCDEPFDDITIENVEENPERFVYIEPLSSHIGYRIMEDFIDTINEKNIKSDLSNAVSGRNPFRNFKDTLYHYPGIQKKWYSFYNDEMKKIIVEWLEFYNIKAELLPIPGEKA